MPDNTSTALITGGTSGIGLATAKKLAQLGIHVLVVGRNAERGKKALEEIRTAGDKADFISSELLGADSVREVARKAIELGNGHVDILINNAGIYPFAPTHEMTEEQFDRVFSTNVKAPYFLVAALALLMAERGKRGNRESFDDGCGLRNARDEPLRCKQGRHQSADENLGCRIWTKGCPRERSESGTHAHGGYGGDGRGSRTASRPGARGTSGNRR
jgi:NAD(P)-dependent dehydrogenase (short-subunit alcohol dehydrogenase family)